MPCPTQHIPTTLSPVRQAQVWRGRYCTRTEKGQRSCPRDAGNLVNNQHYLGGGGRDHAPLVSRGLGPQLTYSRLLYKTAGQFQPCHTSLVEQPLYSTITDMAFKVLVLAALVAAASAGGPAAYSTYTAPASYGSVGATHESTIKGYGACASTTPASATTHKPSLTSPAYAPASYAAPAIASYGGYAAPALAARAYAAPAISAYGGYAAPALAARAYGAPAIASYGGYAAPALAARAYGAPAIASYGGYAALSHVSFAGLGANYGW
uniref:(California timema) hypothetical protein n=1 Tax=Timema californicum TaxID=61474 RepID=A0A7R9J3S1_TIMCA|nr:unnamed protein product [Timema californicum]